jgi:putative addiction module component (TIGR02574 family)
MSPQANEVLQAALQLTDAEKLDLANRLLDTLPPELLDEDEAWAAELNRRANDSPDQFVPWEEVRKQLWSSRD